MDHHNKHPDSPMMTLLNTNVVKHPYRYMRDPMASVPMTRQMVVPYMQSTMKKFVPFMEPSMKRYNMKVPFLEYNPYHHNLEPTYQDMGYMLGERFFKEQAPGRNAEDWDAVNFRGDEEHEDQEQIPYEVIQRYESYEKRKIKSALRINKYQFNGQKVNLISQLIYNWVTISCTIIILSTITIFLAGLYAGAGTYGLTSGY